MLKKFFLIVCGSFVGAFLAMVFVILASIITSFAIMASIGNSSSTSVEKNSILYLNLDGEVTDRSVIDNPFKSMVPATPFTSGNASSISLASFVRALELAADNDDIKLVYLDCRGIAAAPASLFEMRNALVKFKKSGKPIYAYADEGYSQADYYLATAADSIFLNPIGAVDVHGFASSMPFFKGLLDKVGVEMQVVRVGEFKSAVEPYVLEHMSDANRLQISHYIGGVWKCMSDSMAKARNIPADKFNAYADSIMALMPTDTLPTIKVVDNLCYRVDFENKLRKITKLEPKDKLKLVTPSDIVEDEDLIIDKGGKKIAVLYATGEIDGNGGAMPGGDGIDSEQLADDIRELMLDDDVKGLVLRVNSPGGSAFGSEVIWKALDDFKKSGKPFAVSMGEYAASGGYYISSGAQRIFAQPTTITGSIGVFGLIPNYQELAENKLAVHFDAVNTNENSDFGAIYKPLTTFQRQRLQVMVNSTYDLFTKRCADGRNIPQDSIKAIGQGRVWEGITAKKIGLVDEFGGIDEAVAWVAKKAGLKAGKYSAVAYPSSDVSFFEMMSQMQQMRVQSEMRQKMGIFYSTYAELQAIMGRRHVLCLMEPVNLEF